MTDPQPQITFYTIEVSRQRAATIVFLMSDRRTSLRCLSDFEQSCRALASTNAHRDNDAFRLPSFALD